MVDVDTKALKAMVSPAVRCLSSPRASDYARYCWLQASTSVLSFGRSAAHVIHLARCTHPDDSGGVPVAAALYAEICNGIRETGVRDGACARAGSSLRPWTGWADGMHRRSLARCATSG